MSLPSPPCYAVIFVSKQSAQKDAYEETAEHMLELAKRQPGFLGVVSVRGENGTGITISYWTDEKAIKAWKDQPEHQQARWQGRTKWYEGYSVQIVKVERAYSL
ncbi:antibiotic biosynthesis monooxygenase [Pseudomonas sp. MAG002Y]|uniref:antibiotic biosynthesis monooxygenase family protein n=1 Tax=Pseudomonas sp. MAG002Y TaxID=2678690 RepID=UPI001C6102E1|nr:antibiotic biosynthesis monooxygenase [Pseudomonas sp. MAG002Y]MBW5412460.1 antibiotic biosynthesis monooxygenase [Pseudomonas sp. MAG002Y]